ncbi:hypothetical protein MNB_SV-6-961 [hydrothermal vent metagenome]|uniref:Uncharacterized protein n=1 Tax=hydrothermal vent metagenome TaxID=652676 RepID=A0A1W1C6N2_9ZZZZ
MLYIFFSYTIISNRLYNRLLMWRYQKNSLSVDLSMVSYII